MKGKSIVAIVISIIMIVAGGYLLFNLAFLLFALIVNTTMQMSSQSDTDPPGHPSSSVGIHRHWTVDIFRVKVFQQSLTIETYASGNISDSSFDGIVS